MTRVVAFDNNPDALRARYLSLVDAVGDRDSVSGLRSRNALLLRISRLLAEGHEVVAFIDLCTGDVDDDRLGDRIIEQMADHPSLREAKRVAWTAYLSPLVEEALLRAGADHIVDGTELDRDEATRLSTLRALAGLSARPDDPPPLPRTRLDASVRRLDENAVRKTFEQLAPGATWQDFYSRGVSLIADARTDREIALQLMGRDGSTQYREVARLRQALTEIDPDADPRAGARRVLAHSGHLRPFRQARELADELQRLPSFSFNEELEQAASWLTRAQRDLVDTVREAVLDRPAGKQRVTSAIEMVASGLGLESRALRGMVQCALVQLRDARNDFASHPHTRVAYAMRAVRSNDFVARAALSTVPQRVFAQDGVEIHVSAGELLVCGYDGAAWESDTPGRPGEVPEADLVVDALNAARQLRSDF